jgi:hypothetical protein
MPRALRTILQGCGRDFPFFYGKALAEVHSSMSYGLLILLAGAVGSLSSNLPGSQANRNESDYFSFEPTIREQQTRLTQTLFAAAEGCNSCSA